MCGSPQFVSHLMSLLISIVVVQRKEIALILVLYLIMVVFRLLFLYGVCLQHFWLCVSYTVISFGHIIIKSISNWSNSFNILSIVLTSIITIVSILYVMDLFLLKQQKLEMMQTSKEHQKYHHQNNNTNNNNHSQNDKNLKYFATLV